MVVVGLLISFSWGNVVDDDSVSGRKIVVSGIDLFTDSFKVSEGLSEIVDLFSSPDFKSTLDMFEGFDSLDSIFSFTDSTDPVISSFPASGFTGS